MVSGGRGRGRSLVWRSPDFPPGPDPYDPAKENKEELTPTMALPVVRNTCLFVHSG